MMSHYEKLFQPYQRPGYPLESVIKWLHDKTGAKQIIIDQVIAEVMNKLSQGEDFSGSCGCGCPYEDEAKYPDAKISHYMLARVFDIAAQAEKASMEVIQDHQNIITQERQKQLINVEKQMYEAKYGNFWQRNFPTFRKWMRFKD